LEQFAVGFGQRCSPGAGNGHHLGSAEKYEELLAAGEAEGVGETEYRLN